MEGKYTPLTLSNGRDTLIRHMLKIFKLLSCVNIITEHDNYNVSHNTELPLLVLFNLNRAFHIIRVYMILHVVANNDISIDCSSRHGSLGIIEKLFVC